MTATDITTVTREITVLTFDQYGTIVDMQTGLTEAVTPFLHAKGWSGEPHRFVTWWRRTHYEDSMIDALCNQGHTPYREIGHRAAAHVMRRAGIAYTPNDVRWLVSQIETLRPFPEVIAALHKLQTRYRLVILSNGDRDMLEHAKPCLGFDFDQMISVAEAGYFKPHFATYQKAAELIGEDRSRIMHIANHAFDCIGAKASGMRTAWINRRQRPAWDTPHPPDLIVRDFTELAAVLGA